MADPQLAHRGAFATVRDHGGEFRVMNPPFRFSDAAVAVGGSVSALGEDTRSVLDAAGYTEEEIGVLAASGAVTLL